MGDNTVIPAGAGGDTVRDLDRLGAGVKTQVVQLDIGGVAGNAENLVTGALPISAASLPLPTGAATSAKQDTIITALGSPLQAGGTVVANAGTNLNTSALLLDATFTGRVNTQGQKAMAASTPVVIASDQSAVAVSIGGTVTVDTELPAAAALADNTANPTVPGVGSYLMAFDGTNWDRVQTGSAATGALKVDGSAVTQPVSGTVTANQGAAPWAENITQFGGTNLSTGTGTGGAGIPRVTISSDSSLAANQSVNVAQIAGAAAVTGTGVGGAGIPRVTVSSDSQVRVWDGTNQAAVKAASTAAVAADPALVVAISPNNALNINIAASLSANNATTATLGANAVFTGAQDLGENFENFQVSCFSDQNGSLAVQWSSDGANWDMNETFAYVAANGMMTLGLPTRSRRYRIVYTNGAIAQTAFRLQTIMRHVGAAGDTTPINYTIPVNLQAQATRSQLIGQTDSALTAFAASTIKAGGAPPVLSDAALVVAISPNSPSPENASDRVTQFLLSQLLAQSQSANTNLGQGFIPQETPAFLGGF